MQAQTYIDQFKWFPSFSNCLLKDLEVSCPNKDFRKVFLPTQQKRKERYLCLRLLQLELFKDMIFKGMGRTLISPSLKRWQSVNNYNAKD